MYVLQFSSNWQSLVWFQRLGFRKPPTVAVPVITRFHGGIMEIDRILHCKDCGSENIEYALMVIQDLCITFPDEGFCRNCKSNVKITETAQSMSDFIKSCIVQPE